LLAQTFDPLEAGYLSIRVKAIERCGNFHVFDHEKLLKKGQLAGVGNTMSKTLLFLWVWGFDFAIIPRPPN